MVVAVIDTGVDGGHRDLDKNIESSVDACHRTDINSHGTHVAGIVAAERNSKDVAGVAPEAKIVPIRLLAGACVGSATAAVDLAMEKGADVINMSFRRGRPGAPYQSELDNGQDTFEAVLRAAMMRDVVPVTSAGNCGDNTEWTYKGKKKHGWEHNGCSEHNEYAYPKVYSGVIVVANTKNSNGDRAASSTYHEHVGIAAPGSGILSTVPSYTAGSGGPCTSGTTCYVEYESGTSMAAPVISGVVAHLKARFPKASVGEIRQALYTTAKQPGSDETGRWTKEHGWGVVQPLDAIERLDDLFTACPAGADNRGLLAYMVGVDIDADGDDVHDSRVPLVDRYDIWTMDAATGGGRCRRAHDAWQPAWSPDGTQLAFVHQPSPKDEDDPEIWVMDADGTNWRNLTDNDWADYQPVWSPDGTRIAYVSLRGENIDVWVMNADGTNQQNLTHRPASDFLPSWSPDGTRIVFVSTQDGGDFDIWVMNADGTDARNLHDNNDQETLPVWSPDGTRIAFVHNPNEPGQRDFDVWVMDTDGTNWENLTDNDALDTSPAWSPHGTEIAFVSDRGGDYDIWVMDPDGTNSRNLTNTADQHEHHPTWSSPKDDRQVRISWGSDAAGRALCPAGEMCWNLRYEYIGTWEQPPYMLACWVNGVKGKPFSWSGRETSGCLYWGKGTAQVTIDGIRSNQLTVPTPPPPDDREVRISWGSDAAGRSDCPPGERCWNLRYELIGTWEPPPYALECWSNGQQVWADPWSGREATGCYYWGEETAHVIIDGVRSNELTVPAPPPPDDREVRISWGSDAAGRSDCPPGERCWNLRYELIGTWEPPPYALECWSNGQQVLVDPWSGREATGCYYWGEETAQVIIDGVRSNELTIPTAPGSSATPSCGPRSSDGAPCGYLIYEEAFDDDGNGFTDRSEIWVSSADGSDERKLVDGSDPIWSPDGSKIVYLAPSGYSTAMWVMSVDGTGAPRKLHENVWRTEIDEEWLWSPDSTYVAYTPLEEDRFELWAAAVDGSSPPRRLADSVSFYSDRPWSPDSAHVAYIVGIHDDDDGYSDREELWVAAVDGSSPPRRFSPDAVRFGFAWSPVGRRVAFTARTPRSQLELRNADGTDPRVIATDGELPLWSPDGRQVVYRISFGEWWVASADGSGTPRQFAGRDVEGIAWSPDGRRIAYTERVDDDGDGSRDRYELRVVAADGSGEPIPIARDGRLTKTLGTGRIVTDPENGALWSEDGTHLVFNVAVSEADAVFYRGNFHQELWVAPSDGGGRACRLTTSGAMHGWSPTGDHVAYSVLVDNDGDKRAERNSWWVAQPDCAGARKLTDGGWVEGWSPNGTHIAYSVPVDTGSDGKPDRVDVWIVDVAAGGSPLLVTGNAPVYAGPRFSSPAWSPSTVSPVGGPPATELAPVAAATSISAGLSHACVLRADGTAECWGTDRFGESTPPAGGFTAISAGWHYTCGLRADETVECWGSDFSGQSTPPAGAFAAIATGANHTCGLQTGGTLECWGSNRDGQATPPAGRFTAVASSGGYICGLRTDGTAECWGDLSSVQLGSGEEATWIPLSGTFTAITDKCGIRTGGTVECWLSVGHTPTPGGRFAALSTGLDHSCGLRAGGTVECWGENEAGQTTPPSGTFTATASGEGYSCGIRTDGTIDCWGYNDGRATPPGGTFTTVSAGSRNSCGVKTDGTVECWGYNAHGEASPPAGMFTNVGTGFGFSCGLRTGGTIDCWGLGIFTGETTPPSGTFTQIAVGSFHSCAIRTDRRVECWGTDEFGQATPPAGSFTSIAVSYDESCGIRTDGTIQCWGNQQHSGTPPSGTYTALTNQCGIRTDSTLKCWLRFAGKPPPEGQFKALSSGSSHTCGLRPHGTVECWGQDDSGQATPPAGTFTAIAAGWEHTCGVRTDRTVVCWGYDDGRTTPPTGRFGPSNN